MVKSGVQHVYIKITFISQNIAGKDPYSLKMSLKLKYWAV